MLSFCLHKIGIKRYNTRNYDLSKETAHLIERGDATHRKSQHSSSREATQCAAYPNRSSISDCLSMLKMLLPSGV